MKREWDIYDDAIMYVSHCRAGDAVSAAKCAAGHDGKAFHAALGIAIIIPQRKRDKALKAARKEKK